jgi:hypothetical protein
MDKLFTLTNLTVGHFFVRECAKWQHKQTWYVVKEVIMMPKIPALCGAVHTALATRIRRDLDTFLRTMRLPTVKISPLLRMPPRSWLSEFSIATPAWRPLQPSTQKVEGTNLRETLDYELSQSVYFL